MKLDFSETVPACDLKPIEFMQVCEYWRSMSFLYIGPSPNFTNENQNLLFLKTTGPFSTKFYM